jgi:hypothetical protein
MRILQVDEIAVIKAGDYFMIVIGEKMYGKFHIKRLKQIMQMFEGKAQ